MNKILAALMVCLSCSLYAKNLITEISVTKSRLSIRVNEEFKKKYLTETFLSSMSLILVLIRLITLSSVCLLL